VPHLEIVLIIAVLLAAAFLFARIAQHAGFPPAAAITLVGIAAAGMLPAGLQIELQPATLALFLPALIFEAAWRVDVSSLRRTAVAIAVLAVPGVLLTAAIIAGGGIVGGLSLAAALALGAILAATDPVAVLALFRALSVPLDLLTIVEGESIANDGVAAILAAAIVGVTVSGASVAPVAVAGACAYACAVGIACGVVLGVFGTPLLRRFRSPWIAIPTTLAIAYGSYGIATLLGASGILACAAAGVALPALDFDPAEARAIERFWDRTSFLANAVVFLLVGLSLRLERIFSEPRLFAAVVVALVASRAMLAYVIVPLGGAPAARAEWRHALALAGVRGGLSLALALGLPHAFPDRPAVVDAVFAVVFLTLVVQGWTLAPLLRRLRLSGVAAPVPRRV
jgi:CPA1 family monovalent cation:H+ antiporter